ncbi:hypothetical protein M8C21_032922 [Ambrosia artemisiifolia]|uniref:Uncharacterized protein n=1 Tax=Ambrosia artemisiifolia TaxID=4212 RepID=A0AAD5CIP3_AMBAR|nr:hypothetical protein M8C21_032922 [Ambrosia artemisiifolia]
MAEQHPQLAQVVGEPFAPVAEIPFVAHPDAEQEIQGVDSAHLRWLFDQAYGHEIRLSHQQELMEDTTTLINARLHEQHVTQEKFRALRRTIRTTKLLSKTVLALFISMAIYRLYKLYGR